METARDTIRVRDICSLRSGVTLRERSDSPASKVLTLQIADLGPTGSVSTQKLLRVPLPAWSSRHIVATGEVVFWSRGPFWSAWAAEDLGEPLVAVAPLFIIRPVSDILDARYLAWWLGRPSAQQHFAASAMGTGVKMITKSALEQTPIVLPPLDEQGRIADTAALVARELDLALSLARLRSDVRSARLDLAATDPDR